MHLSILEFAQKHNLNVRTVYSFVEKGRLLAVNKNGKYFIEPSGEKAFIDSYIPPTKITKEFINLLNALRSENLSWPEISKKTGVALKVIHRCIYRYDLPKSLKRKYSIDLNYFKEINNEEKAYWLGFIYADGSVNYKGKLTIEIQNGDHDHLLKFAKSINYNGPIKVNIRNNKKYSLISLNSVEMVRDIIKLGVNPNKTTNPSAPNVPDQFFMPFLRGFFDGDGCLSFTDNKRKTSKRVHIGFLFHIKLKEFFLEKFSTIFSGLSFKEIPHHRTKYIISLCKTGIQNARVILHKLYSNASIYLDRKYDKFVNLENYAQSRSNNPQGRDNKKCKYRGIIPAESSGKFIAVFRHKYLGTFSSQEDAALAWNKEAKGVLGELAILNIIDGIGRESLV